MEEAFVYFDVGAALYDYDSDNGYPFPINDPEKHQYLKQYVGIDPLFQDKKNDGKYHYHCCAIGSTKCEKLLHVTSYNENSSFFKTDPDNQIPDIQKRHIILKSIPVSVVPLSDIIEMEGGVIDILKIDTQGYELEVLKSLGNYIQSIYAIHVEMWFNDIHYPGIPLYGEINSFLDAHGYYKVKLISKCGNFAVDILYLNKRMSTIDNIENLKKLYTFYSIRPEDPEIVNSYIFKILRQMEL
jgi:FkbM family methyltransferase